jgi:1-deoxy-D-xylulose-5-phosphate synthase
MFQRIRHAIKHGLLQQSNLFESLNFRYFGPVDGHDVVALTKVLCDLRNIPGPKLLHVMTVKGKGYAPAEDNQPLWHAPGCFNPETGELITADDGSIRFQDVFGHTLVRLAEQNPRVVGITPAMPTGCSMNLLMDRMPERCFDVGIAEGHAVTFSAGLAASGLIPFCNIYSSFMQRAIDNVIHDVALQNLGVVFCLDRAGLVGEDGATHHGVFDIALFRPIPNMIIAAPMDEAELKDLMYTASESGKPFMIRYPRGCGLGIPFETPFNLLPVGKGRVLREGGDVALISLGTIGRNAAAAAEIATAKGVSVLHIDLRYAKPLDEELLHRVGRDFDRVVTVEEGSRDGGAGSAVLEFFAANGYTPSVVIMGTGDEFIEQGTVAELHHLCSLSPKGILEKIILT